MYKAALKIDGNNMIIRLFDDDSEVIKLYPSSLTLSILDAKMLRLWLVGMIDTVAPFEHTLAGKEIYLDYELWFPIREALNEWYEANYA